MSDLVVREPTSLVAVEDQCASIEVWAERCDSVPELRDAGNKLAAIDEYLSRTSSEGRARVSAAMRRLEVRIGQLLGPPPGQGTRTDTSPHAEKSGLHPQREADFRQMAAHPEVVENVISESTDNQPASRSQVLRSINSDRQVAPRSVDLSRAAVTERENFVRALAKAGNTAGQIAENLGIAPEGVKKIARRINVEIPADVVVGGRRRVDSNRIVDETVGMLEGLAMGLDLVEYTALDANLIGGWVISLSSSLRSLNRLHKQLKETSQ